MIKAQDIKDVESLQSWLEEWPIARGMAGEMARKPAVTIASRIAMRNLPLAWEW